MKRGGTDHGDLRAGIPDRGIGDPHPANARDSVSQRARQPNPRQRTVARYEPSAWGESCAISQT